MSEDYKQGYKDGWKDGYEQAKKDTLNVLHPLPQVCGNPPPHSTLCRVCGLDLKNMSNYVCSNMYCPSKVTCGPAYSTAKPVTLGGQHSIVIKDPGADNWPVDSVPCNV